MAKRLKHRITDGPKYVELEADIDAVTHQIVNDDDEVLSPDVLLNRGNSWIPLKEYPEVPWLDDLAERAVQMVKASKIKACENYCKRLLRFANERECEAVWIAKLLLGHIRFISKEYHEAISHWQAAAKSCSRVRTVAYSNLGVAWALIRQPVPAIQCLDMAIASKKDFLLAHISRQNLASTLIKEGAPDLPGRPTWKDIQKKSSEQIRATNKADTSRLLSSDSPFPTYHVIHVFKPGSYCPAISCQLAHDDVKEPAARQVLDAANAAFLEGKYRLSLELSRRAAKTSAKVAPAANTLSKVTGAKIQELESKREASRYVDTMKAFFESLGTLGKDFTEPEEFLVLLKAHQAESDEYAQLYRDAITESLYNRLRYCSNKQERTWILTLIGLLANQPVAEAHSQAANIRRARPFLIKFWNACSCRDMTGAALALKKAEAHTGKDLHDLRRVLENLKSISKRPVTRKKSLGHRVRNHGALD